MADRCSNCNQMKSENKQLRTALIDTNKNYVEVVNENLSLRRELESSTVLREAVKALRIPHQYCEDCWYSCPKSVDGSCNDNYTKDECICGADDHNTKLDAILRLII